MDLLFHIYFIKYIVFCFISDYSRVGDGFIGIPGMSDCLKFAYDHFSLHLERGQEGFYCTCNIVWQIQSGERASIYYMSEALCIIYSIATELQYHINIRTTVQNMQPLCRGDVHVLEVRFCSDAS